MRDEDLRIDSWLARSYPTKQMIPKGLSDLDAFLHLMVPRDFDLLPSVDNGFFLLTVCHAGGAPHSIRLAIL